MNIDKPETPQEPDIERELDDLAHALRSPLTALRGGLDLLNDSGRDGLDDISRRGLDVALSATRRLTALIDDTLLLARYRAGRLNLVLSVETAREVVNEALRTYRTQQTRQGMEFDVELIDVEVVSDIEMVASVIGRLIDLSASSPETVHISARAREDDVLFEISADGPVAGKRNSATENAISVCRAVIELHGGVLSVPGADASESGTTFSFTLPTAD